MIYISMNIYIMNMFIISRQQGIFGSSAIKDTNDDLLQIEVW